MKTAYELAMEKLRRKDAETGESRTPLDEEQKKEIGEIRTIASARLAEREILYQADLRKARGAGDPEEIKKVEEAYRKDRTRIEEDREAKIRAVRDRAGGD